MDQRSTATVVKAFLVTSLCLTNFLLGIVYHGRSEVTVTNGSNQVANVADANSGFWCSLRDWINWPRPTTPIAEVDETPVSRDVTETKANAVVFTTTTTRSPSSPSSVVNQYITEEYITNPVVNEVVREVVIRDRNVDTSSYITEDSYKAQVDGFLTSIEDGDSAITDSIGEAVDTELLTVSGNTTLSCSLTLATLGGGVLQTDASGVVSTTTVGAASITANSLDFAQFKDAMTVDATTSFDLDTNNADLDFDSGTLFVDSSLNRIGIGTSVPQFAVDLENNQNSRTNINVRNLDMGASASAGYTMISSGIIGFLQTNSSNAAATGYARADAMSLFTDNAASGGIAIAARGAPAYLTIHTGGSTERMRVDNVGNVGIGTTTPSAKLHITGTAGSSDIFTISSSSNSRLLTVTAAGNVGIGTSTPATKLHVVYQGIESTTTPAVIIDTASFWATPETKLLSLRNNGVQMAAFTQYGGLYMGRDVYKPGVGLFTEGSSEGRSLVSLRNVASGDPAQNGLSIWTISDDEYTQGSGLDLQQTATQNLFYMNSASSSNSAQLDLHLTPISILQRFHVDSTIRTLLNPTETKGASSLAYLFDTSTNLTNSTARLLSVRNNGTSTFDIMASGNVGIGTTTAGARLSLQTTGTADILNLFETGGTEVFTVLENGNVGIGTTSPSSFKLQVAGNIGTDADNTYTLGAVGLDFECVYYQGGNLVTCASDRNLKTNITDLTFKDEEEGALDKLSLLQIRSFEFKSAPNDIYHGLIAQEVETVLPQLVMTRPNGYKAINYGDIQWLTIEAIQELNSRTKYIESLATSLEQSSSTVSLSQNGVLLLWERLVKLAEAFSDGILSLVSAEEEYVKSERIETYSITTKELCVEKTDGEKVCVTGDELHEFFNEKNDTETIVEEPSSSEGTSIQENNEENVDNSEGVGTETEVVEEPEEGLAEETVEETESVTEQTDASEETL